MRKQMHFIVVRQSGKRSGFVIYHLKYIAFTRVLKKGCKVVNLLCERGTICN